MKLTRNSLRAMILKEMNDLNEAPATKDQLWDDVVAEMQNQGVTGPITNVIRSIIASRNLSPDEARLLPELIGTFASSIAERQLEADDEGELDLY